MKIRKSNKEWTWKCDICNEVFRIRREMLLHKQENHSTEVKNFNSYRECYCKYCGRKGITKSSMTIHEKTCIENPNKIKLKGHKHSEESKKQISLSMKKAHEERRLKGWRPPNQGNISWPEKWFTRVIENEIEDKNYVTEMKFGRYWLDFAWPAKQLCVEIDGCQHEREHLRISDIKKDSLLVENGWKVLRLRWVDCYHDPKKCIDIAKTFISSGEIIELDKRWKPKKKKKKVRPEGWKSAGERRIEKRAKRLSEYGINENGNFNTLSKDEHKRRKELILNVEKIRGWKSNIAHELGISHTQLARYMKNYID